MELHITCDLIINRVKRRSEEIESIREKIKKCFTKLDKELDGKRLSFDFGLRCLTAISTSVPTQKTEWTSDVWSVSEVVSLLLTCHDHLLKSRSDEIAVSRCLYNVLINVLDVDFTQALIVSKRLLENLMPLTNDKTLEDVRPIARNCFAKLWNAAILYEQARWDALKLRLESLSYLSFVPSEASKFCLKAVHAVQVYNNAIGNNDVKDIVELNDFTVRILDMFHKRLIDVTQDIVSLSELMIKLVRLTLQQFLNRDRFDFAHSLITKARETFDSISNRTRSMVTFELDVCESFVGLLSNLAASRNKCMKISELLSSCVDYLANHDQNDDFLLTEKRSALTVYFVKIQMRSIVEKVCTASETSLVILPCIRTLSKFVTTIARAMKHASIDDSLYLYNTMLLLHSYILKAVVPNEVLFEIVDDATKLVKMFASFVSKLTTEKLLDGISLFLSSSYMMVYFLCQRKMYVECLPFVHPYAGFLIRSYSAKDETFWKRMNTLLFCLNKAEMFKEALQVIAEFLSKDLGRDKEAVDLWVLVKREAFRMNDTTTKAITMRSLVSPLICCSSEAKRIRLASLLKLELEAFKSELYTSDDVVYAILCDLIQVSTDPLEMSYALIQMARCLLWRSPNYDRKRDPIKCCQQALKLLEKSKRTKKTVFVFGSDEDCLTAQAKFILYLAGMQTRYSVLEERITKQELKLSELKKKQREDAEKANPAASEKIDFDDDEGMAMYESSTLHEEFQVLAELDSCVQLWRSILDANSDAIGPFVADVLQDLKCAVEIYATARFFSQEVSTWELFLMIAKRSEMWSDSIHGLIRLGTTLTRMGLTKRAESLLEEATDCMEKLKKDYPELASLTVLLLLAKSELYLMKNRIAKGWEQLCLAKLTIKEARRTKSILLLKSVALALESKYSELPSFIHVGRSEREVTPIEAMSEALRQCSSLLAFTSKEGQLMTMLFKQQLLACIMDCSYRLGQLHYNQGSPRSARCYLTEVSSWTRRFFFVNRTIEVTLLISRVYLLAEDTSMCQAKLNEVQWIMDSTDVTSPSIDPTLSVESTELDGNHDDGFVIISPVVPDRFISIPSTLPPVTSPCLRDVRCDSSLKEHDIKCKCVKCKHIIVHQLRAESIFVQHELSGMPSESTRQVLKHAQAASETEKGLVAKFAKEKPVSRIKIRSCWFMARMAEKQLADGSTKAALSTVTSALANLATYHWDGIAELHFLDATLKYQKCVAQLVIQSRREGKASVSQLCDPMWATSANIVDIGVSSDVEALTAAIASVDISKPFSDFKTPKHKPLSSRIQSGSVNKGMTPVISVKKDTSTKKRVQFACAAPMKTKPKMSFFENVFSSEESDSDNEEQKKTQITIIEISDDDDNAADDESPTVFNSAKNAAVTPSNKKESTKSHKTSSSKGVVGRLQTATTFDKENSDNEDFSPLKSTRKRRPHLGSVLDVISVDFKGSPLRNPTPKRDSSPLVIKDPFNVERIREEETDYEKDEARETKTNRSKRTTRKVPKTMIDTVGRRTRSRIASAVEEVEINRGESPKETSSKMEKKGGVSKTTTVVRRNILGSDSDQEFSMDMDDVISTLDKAVRCVEHHPHVPLYGDLNLLLALCKGERAVSSVGHVLESVGITLRHSAIDRLQSNLTAAASVDDCCSENVTSNLVARRKFLTFGEGSLQFKDGSKDESLRLVTDKLPKDWVVCQINKLPDVLTGNAMNPELLVTRLQKGQNPVVVKIASSNRTQGARDFLSEFHDIMAETKLSVRVKEVNKWWKNRKALDGRLKMLLQSMEDVWLGPWKCLLLGRPQHEIDQKKLRKVTKQILSDVASFKLPSVNEHLLELVVDCWPWLQSEHLNVALSHACGVSATNPLLRKMCAVVNNRIAGLWSIGMTRQFVILILDKTVHCLPWENLPILRANPVSRMPSVHFLLGHLAVHCPLVNSDTNVPNVDASNSFFIVNPSGDLVKTENCLKAHFDEELKWPGIVGRPPTKDEWMNTLNKRDLFFYCGHGAGSKYASGDVIEKKLCRATTALMGCSSASLTAQGRNLESHGIILQYLIAGCPCVLGNLWDVTDKDIDKLTIALLKNWIPGPNRKDKCVLQCLSSSREETILTYLIGCAPVVYGIPVYTRTAC